MPKKNLLFFIQSLASGGAERVTANMANYWAKNGWSVTVVTMTGTDLDFYELHPTIKRIPLNLAGSSSNQILGLLNNIKRIFALRALLKEVKPEVAIAMMSTASVVMAFASWGVPNIAAIGTERTHPPRLPLSPIWEKLRSFSYGKLKAVVALTSESATWLENNTNAPFIAIIPNAVIWPLTLHQPIIDPETLIASDKKIILAVGRLDQHKGFATLIDIFAKIAPKHPDWLLVILGEGFKRGDFEQQVQSHGAQKQILLPGVMGNISQWYLRANIYILSSDYEGFPNTLVEAMAHGLAPISFDCETGPRDIIRNNSDGILIPPGDKQALQEAVEKLIENHILRQQYGKQAMDVRERFAVEKIAEKWESLFTKLTGF
ncbi:MAG: glycosyltransferase family 4 protein [Magnetococcales bacterium]|nr:glycosyltransferase family 4 protein [Magnetococcales bacterium]